MKRTDECGILAPDYENLWSDGRIVERGSGERGSGERGSAGACTARPVDCRDVVGMSSGCRRGDARVARPPGPFTAIPRSRRPSARSIHRDPAVAAPVRPVHSSRSRGRVARPPGPFTAIPRTRRPSARSIHRDPAVADARLPGPFTAILRSRRPSARSIHRDPAVADARPPGPPTPRPSPRRRVVDPRESHRRVSHRPRACVVCPSAVFRLRPASAPAARSAGSRAPAAWPRPLRPGARSARCAARPAATRAACAPPPRSCARPR